MPARRVMPKGASEEEPTFDLSWVDCGIRETVALLRASGFKTTDSGDGKSKKKALAEGLALPFPHVFSVTAPERLLAESHRMAEVLGEEWEVEASYNPRDRTAILFARRELERRP